MSINLESFYLSDGAMNIMITFKTNQDDLNIRTLMSVNEIKASRRVQSCMGGNVCSDLEMYVLIL